MAEYKPGSMDIRTQQKTFEKFIRMVIWTGVIAVLVLVVMALSDA